MAPPAAKKAIMSLLVVNISTVMRKAPRKPTTGQNNPLKHLMLRNRR